MVVLATKAYIMDSSTVSGTAQGRVREFAASTDSCVSSTFSSGNMDFSVSGSQFSAANGILTWQGSPPYSYTTTALTLSTLAVS